LDKTGLFAAELINELIKVGAIRHDCRTVILRTLGGAVVPGVFTIIGVLLGFGLGQLKKSCARRKTMRSGARSTQS
jgi:hypothetical protein